RISLCSTSWPFFFSLSFSPRLPVSTLFPYTTLFRSKVGDFLKKLSKDHTINHFSPDLKSVMTVDLNEQFMVETHDCYGGQVKDEDTLSGNIDRSILNLATGPIFINVLKIRDVVKLNIDNIELGSYVIMMTDHGLGDLGNTIQSATSNILPVNLVRVQFTEILSIPVDTMISVIDLAIAQTVIHTTSQGSHCDNTDTTDIKQGNALYLPEFQDSGILAMGDLNNIM